MSHPHAYGKDCPMVPSSAHAHAPVQRQIVLLGINARYHHSAFGLRYLKANLGALEAHCEIVETTIRQSAAEIAEAALKGAPRIIGVGVYVWNATLACEVVEQIRIQAPGVVLVVGGPEVSHEWAEQRIVHLADYTVTGEGERGFRELCEAILNDAPPTEHLIHSPQTAVTDLALPYHLYTDEDIAQRVIYIEASRGCPFKCQFCLSSLDRSLRMLPQGPFFTALHTLIERGVKEFKFIDRTFNLRIQDALAVLDFFLERWRPDMSLHFEMVPDRLPPELKSRLERFPPGSVQLEIGIQTFNVEVGRLIERRQNLTKTSDNLRYLRAETGVHIHADLIAGLPGETLASFADGFNRLVALQPQEIQVGILKRLRGTPIKQHTLTHGMRYSAVPPYEVRETAHLSEDQLNHIKRFSRFWDLIANSGNFIITTRHILTTADTAFDSFSELTRWLYRHFGRTHRISLNQLAEAVFIFLIEGCGRPNNAVAKALAEDLHRTPGRKTPGFLKPVLGGRWRPEVEGHATGHLKQRQARHVLVPAAS